MRKVVPARGSLSTQTKPSLCFTMPYTVDSPNPVPWPSGLVVKNGSKIRVCTSGGIPLPELEPACYQYAPRSTALHETVTRVAECYRERRVAVITLIASKPIENVRAFSDAFRIRRKKEE